MIIKLKDKIKYISGMTLIELMVVISIFAAITTITIFDYGSFNSNVSIANLSDDIALSIRKAQSFAIGTQQTQGSFEVGYGVHFTTEDPSIKGKNNDLSGSSKNFILYTDFATVGGYVYDKNNQNAVCGKPTSTNECSEILSLNGSNEINKITVYFSNGTNKIITNDASNFQKGSLDIIFHRPNPDALFCYKAKNDSGSGCTESSGISHVEIVVSNGQTDISKIKSKTIVVYNTGQISLK